MCCAASSPPVLSEGPSAVASPGHPSGFCNWLASMRSLWFVEASEAASCKCQKPVTLSIVHSSISSVGRDLALIEPETVW